MRRAEKRKRDVPNEALSTRQQKVVVRSNVHGQAYSAPMSAVNSNMSAQSHLSVASSREGQEPDLRSQELAPPVHDAILACQIQQAIYSRPVVGAKTRSKAQGTNTLQELEPEMDDMVNAGRREWKCYHAPSMIYFGNDSIGV